jgi:hypothetical protein
VLQPRHWGPTDMLIYWMLKYLLVSRPFVCLQMKPPLRREDGLVFWFPGNCCWPSPVVILSPEPRETHGNILLSHNSGSRTTTSVCRPGNLLLALVSTVKLGFGSHDHIFVLFKAFTVLKGGFFFEERRGLTTTGHSPSTGGVTRARIH